MQATTRQGTWQKQWGMLVARVWDDPDLKQRLLADPAAVLAEHGIEIPEGVDMRVVEDTEQVRYLVLPTSPTEELSDDELTCSVGYDCFSGLCGGCWRCGCGSRRCGCDANS